MKHHDFTGSVFAIWLGLGVIAFGLGIYGAETNANITEPLMMAMFMGLLATILVIALPYLAQVNFDRDKAKRHSDDTLATLLAMLDEDERAAFKQAMQRRLLDQIGPAGGSSNGAADDTADGELPANAETLSDLLRDQRRR